MKVILEFRTDQPPIDDKTILAIVETNMGTEMFVAVVDEYGDLKFPDTGDDIGWDRESVSMWADLSNINLAQQQDSPDTCKCEYPDNDMVPFGDHCLACGGTIRR